MTYLHTLSLSFLANTIIVHCIWPPAYKINLTHEEEIIIGEYTESNEDLYNAEDEMIQDVQIENFHINEENVKFDRLHKQVKRYNDRQTDSIIFVTNNIAFNEEHIYTDTEESEPFQAGFVDRNNNFLKDKNIMVKDLTIQKIEEKREEKEEPEYNYEDLDNEYKAEVQKEQNLSDTFNATNVQDEESVQEAVDKITDLKVPDKCTEKQLSGIGIGALKCIWKELRHTKDKTDKRELFYHLRRIITIWFLIYLAIAVPFWCQKGWCCCCFQCRFCKPRKRIQAAKKYLLDNPPGSYLTKDDQTINYEPTDYENNAYLKLQKTLMHL